MEQIHNNNDNDDGKRTLLAVLYHTASISLWEAAVLYSNCATLRMPRKRRVVEQKLLEMYSSAIREQFYSPAFFRRCVEKGEL